MTEWVHEFVLAAREREAGRSADLLRAVRSGALVPVTRGVYRQSDARTTDPSRRDDDDYVALIRASQLRASSPLIFRGMSAAALWGLPVVGSWPESVAVSSAPEAGGRSNAHLVRSYVGHPPPTVQRDGLTLTTLARTVCDVARTESLERAVAIADAALRGTAGRAPVRRAALLRDLSSLGSVSGVGRARGVLSFADGRSASAGESCSRVGIWRLGLPAPELQHEIRDSQGLAGIVDFWWPTQGVAGEFDGRGKYLRDEYTKGRSTADVVLDEKRREDRLRALGLRVVRWGWGEAMDLRSLERVLSPLR